MIEKEKDAKSKGERERYHQLNMEFQTIRRDKKASFSEQCIRLEEEVTEGERL